MSYDFTLSRRRNEEPRDFTLNYDSRGLPTTPIDPAKEAIKQKIASALTDFDPSLRLAKIDFKAAAVFWKITEDEARTKFRSLELNDNAPENTGIQIEIFDDGVCVSVPFWHTGPKAEQVFRKIWKYLEMIKSVSGYTPYDSQLEPSELNLQTDFKRSLTRYTGGVSYTRGAVWKLLLKHGWRFFSAKKSK